MSKLTKLKIQNVCDDDKESKFTNSSKIIVKKVKHFNLKFCEFLERERKSTKELANSVSRYNMIDSGGPCHDPNINLENLLQYFLINIQERTKAIYNSAVILKGEFDELCELQKTIEIHSTELNWNPVENPAIRGTIKSRSPSELLEDINDIIFQFDVALSCIFHYYDALNLKDSKTYENLTNCMKISTEFSECVSQFLIKNHSLLG